MDNAASSPDIRDSTFTRNLTLRSNGGALRNHDGSAPVLTDVTFTLNVARGYGGGMHSNASSPQLVRCVFHLNRTDLSGGGMRNGEGSNPSIVDSVFGGNAAVRHGGGISNVGGSDPIVEGTTFVENEALEHGGGLHNLASAPTITDSLFEENTAGLRGGAVHNDGSTPTFIGTRFLRNETTDTLSYGGGMSSIDGSRARVEGGAFEENTTPFEGGGVFLASAETTLIDTVLLGNDADSGGGLFAGADSELSMDRVRVLGNTAENGAGGFIVGGVVATIANSLFSGNLADVSGGGLIVSGDNDVTLANDTLIANEATGGSGGGLLVNGVTTSVRLGNAILWGNTAGFGTLEEEQLLMSGSGLTVEHSLLEGLSLYAGSGNLGDAPRFRDAPGPDGTFGTPDDDVRLRPCSPAIDAGDDTIVPPGLLLDLNGDDRFTGTVDMGATERSGCAGDVTGDGIVDFGDVLPILGAWGGRRRPRGRQLRRDRRFRRRPDRARRVGGLLVAVTALIRLLVTGERPAAAGARPFSCATRAAQRAGRAWPQSRTLPCLTRRGRGEVEGRRHGDEHPGARGDPRGLRRAPPAVETHRLHLGCLRPRAPGPRRVPGAGEGRTATCSWSGSTRMPP